LKVNYKSEWTLFSSILILSLRGYIKQPTKLVSCRGGECTDNYSNPWPNIKKYERQICKTNIDNLIIIITESWINLHYTELHNINQNVLACYPLVNPIIYGTHHCSISLWLTCTYVSEWLLFNAKVINLPAISWGEQVTFDEMMC
jgi:hypothetical protein